MFDRAGLCLPGTLVRVWLDKSWLRRPARASRRSCKESPAGAPAADHAVICRWPGAPVPPYRVIRRPPGSPAAPYRVIRRFPSRRRLITR
jgi:hypothetical protein